MAAPLAVGMVLRFTGAGFRAEYGETARITEISRTISRPYGTITTWLDLETANGTRLQWALSTVRGRLRVARGKS